MSAKSTFTAMENKHIGILGATGYTGIELLKLIRTHAQMEIDFITSEKYAGQRLDQVYPSMKGKLAGELIFISMSEASGRQVDGVFSCLPHKTAAEQLTDFLDQEGLVIVDLSADFRLDSAEVYERYYCPHPRPELLNQSIYGLVELNEQVKMGATLIGSPGCYPTSILLPLVPLLRDQLVSFENLIADSKSGTSGAGKKLSETSHFMEVHDSFSAYGIGDVHRHCSEINEQLSSASGHDVEITFTPHLLPIARGILSTIYADVEEGVSFEDIKKCLDSQYSESPFVTISNSPPKTAWVRGTNQCMIYAQPIHKGKKIVIISVIDNLVKGASGQALQNMNVALGLSETLGLEI